MSNNEPHGPDAVSNTLKDCETLKKHLDRLVRILRQATCGAPMDAYTQLRRSRRLVEDVIKDCTQVPTTLNGAELLESLSTVVKERTLSYRVLLEEALKKEKIEFIGEWPTYIADDIVRLEVRLGQLDALVDGKRANTIEPERLGHAVRARIDGLLKSGFEPPEFVSMLARAYDDLAQKGNSPGGYVGIRDVFELLKREVVNPKSPYSEQQFAVDVYRVLSTVQSGRVIELSPAQDAAGGLYIPGRKASGNYIAAMRIQ
jgi:hypothetical protein